MPAEAVGCRTIVQTVAALESALTCTNSALTSFFARDEAALLHYRRVRSLFLKRHHGMISL